MKIRLSVEKSGKKASVEFTENQIRDMYDWFYMSEKCERCTRLMQINKVKIDSQLFQKFEHIIHDIIDDGRSYKFKNGKRHLCKERHYFVKKPQWR